MKEAMKADLLLGGYIQADEIRVRVQVHTKEGVNHSGYFWQSSRPKVPVVYEFRMGRERAAPKAFLGSDNGVLQTDGYAAYEKVGGRGMKHVCCLAHVRRKFYKTLQVDHENVRAGFVLLKIGELRELVMRAAKEALPQSLLRKACQYALKLWSRLDLIMGDGRIEVDNNWVENGIRPIALGRKN